MAFTTLEANIFKISGSIGPGGVISAGSALQSVRLTTIDFDSGPPAPLFGIERPNIDPGLLQAGEAVSIRINGAQILSEVPNAYFTTINTNAGSFQAFVFAAGGSTYVIPQGSGNFGAVSSVAANSTVGTQAATINTTASNLLPENANTFSGGVYFVTSGFGPEVEGVRGALVYDADNVRGNADSSGEELELFAGGGELFSVTPREVLASIQFDDGTVLNGVRGLSGNLSGGAYTPTTSTYLFDDAALAASGHTLGDIARILSTTATDHNLNWEELGFNLTQAGDGGPVTPDPVPVPVFNEIFGTSRANTINGTAGRDAIHGLGGNDQLNGGAGRDVFYFGAETRDGRRDTDTIRNYEAGIDQIAFEDAAVIRSVTNIAGGVRIVFEGDRDAVNVFGNGVNNLNVNIFPDEFIV
jgi:RTX calcium-binding nonapeptide repeat (4 copies)